MKWLKYFSEHFYTEIISLEAYLTLLKGYKNYNFYLIIIEAFEAGFDLEESEKEYEKHYNSTILPVLEEAYNEYSNLLIEYFSDELKAKGIKENVNIIFEKIEEVEKSDPYNVDMKVKLYQEVTGLIERTLEFSMSKEKIKSPSSHTMVCEVYDDTFDILNTVQTDFYEALNLLLNILDKEQIRIKLYEMDELDFILIVVSSEAWNFLSHLTYSYQVHSNPDNLEENLKRATRHLERAILDIYKFLITELKIINFRTLETRRAELMSFGQYEKLHNTYNDYSNIVHDFFQDNIELSNKLS